MMAKRKLSTLLITIFSITIPAFLVGYLSDQIDWFDDGTEQMSAQQKLVHYTEIIIDDPEDEDAYYERGRVYFQMRKTKEAIRDFTKTIELDPDNDWAYFSRGDAWMSLLKKDKALSDVRKALEINPDNEIAKTYLEVVFKEKIE